MSLGYPFPTCTLPALPCPALPCPDLTCPALPCLRPTSFVFMSSQAHAISSVKSCNKHTNRMSLASHVFTSAAASLRKPLSHNTSAAVAGPSQITLLKKNMYLVFMATSSTAVPSLMTLGPALLNQVFRSSTLFAALVASFQHLTQP